MFTWINKQGVKSDQGFEVQSIDRFSIEYRECGKVLTIHVEHGFCGGPCVLIDDDAFNFWDGSKVLISPAEQRRLLYNFTEAMKFQGIGVS
jgi:hypothetical protein